MTDAVILVLVILIVRAYVRDENHEQRIAALERAALAPKEKR